ncbi:MAG TPA: NAD(P)H-hydrate dehydratase [Spirochaetota bacterium]|nr:NAD(P)H-hydrate dehydratase [Spirochaetota bacterium]HPI89151.1 NAD(P)H-hydrate dehydratase [Spirochaetota bacterium]HPR46854.1 NAD(P)H-hydrate dehydratase [Spirochaetota bacterium]
MKAVTAEQMRQIDRIAIEERGIPGEVLMSLAGKEVADHVIRTCPGSRKVAVLAGTGNNGGDGFIAAYWLFNHAKDVDVFLIGTVGKLSSSSSIYHKLCINSGIPVDLLNKESSPLPDFTKYDVILDAMIGTGFTGNPRSPVAEIIAALNSLTHTPNRPVIVAVDIPSGLPSEGPVDETGPLMADCTVTMGLPKLSLVTYPGKKFAGDLFVADIGFPRDLTGSSSLNVELIDSGMVASRIAAPRDPDTYKYAQGNLLLIGGFDGMEGAIMMCAAAAIETGAGLVTCLTTEKARTVIAGKIPELITLSLPEKEADLSRSIPSLLGTGRYDAVVMGPGMGRTKFAATVFSTVMENLAAARIPKALIDGDGLNHLAAMRSSAASLPAGQILLTPHFSEAAKLLGDDIAVIKKDRINSARRCSRAFNAVTLLKGPCSLVSDGERCFINTTGGPALATAGSGDVLAGITGSFMLKNISLSEAASCGAYIHGRAADLICGDQFRDSLKATDLISALGKALDSIYR